MKEASEAYTLAQSDKLSDRNQHTVSGRSYNATLTPFERLIGPQSFQALSTIRKVRMVEALGPASLRPPREDYI